MQLAIACVCLLCLQASLRFPRQLPPRIINYLFLLPFFPPKTFPSCSRRPATNNGDCTYLPFISFDQDLLRTSHVSFHISFCPTNCSNPTLLFPAKSANLHPLISTAHILVCTYVHPLSTPLCLCQPSSEKERGGRGWWLVRRVCLEFPNA